MDEKQKISRQIAYMRKAIERGDEVDFSRVDEIFTNVEKLFNDDKDYIDTDPWDTSVQFKHEREPLDGEKEMPIHSVCHRCRKPIRFEPLQDQKLPHFDSVAKYSVLTFTKEEEFNGPKSRGLRYDSFDSAAFCPECSKFIEDLLKMR